jgi:beta-ribofuranosylaminobenzene 5'-phosphate synthase
MVEELHRIELVEHQASRALLLRHGIGLMRAALGVNNGLRVEVEVHRHYPHCGLGTSSLMVAVVAIAINELYGRPIPDDVLARYLAQNHGEEVADDEAHLLPVQCLGGSGVANLFEGALQVLAGETTIIATMRIPETYHTVIGVPVDRHALPLDAAVLMAAEVGQAAGFAQTGRQFAPRVAYDLVHEGLPGMARGDFSGIGKIVFNHRFNWGSIRNCRFSHPRLLEIADGVRCLWEDGTAPILGLSSAGPAFYAITEHTDACIRVFERHGLETFTAPLFNGRYRILNRQD